jgi:hypothetical protein
LLAGLSAVAVGIWGVDAGCGDVGWLDVDWGEMGCDVGWEGWGVGSGEIGCWVYAGWKEAGWGVGWREIGCDVGWGVV